MADSVLIHITEARLQDMDAILELVAASGLQVSPEAVLHSYSLVAKHQDEILAAAVGTFDASGESVVTLIKQPGDQVPEGLLDKMAHKACKKMRSHRNRICRIKHPEADGFWRSIHFIKPAA